MKRLLPIILTASLPLSLCAQTIIYSEDFEGGANGDLVAQTFGDPWSTWSNQPGSSDDSALSDEQAVSGALSLKLESGSTAGGPGDVVLKLGDRTSGSYALNWEMYIPSGFGGYYNVQHNESIGTGSWGIEITFKPDGVIDFLSNNVISTGSFPHDTWFTVTTLIDLGQTTGTVAIDGTTQHTCSTTVNATGGAAPNQLGAINFFAFGGAGNMGKYYVDDVSFTDITSVNVEEVNVEVFNIYPNPTQEILFIEAPAGSQRYDLFDVAGRTVISGSLTNSAGRTPVEVAGLPEGIYMLRIDGAYVRQVVKN
jgi:hypothetical protein